MTEEVPDAVQVAEPEDAVSSAVQPDAPTRGSDRRWTRRWRFSSSFRWAVIAFLPFGLYCIRVLANTSHIYLLSDVAVLDMNMRSAAGFHQLLGAFSRFDLRHPGPVFVYLASFVARVVGLSHGEQALLITSALVAGLSLAATVYAVGRMGGSSVAAAATIGVLLVALLTTDQLEVDPWNPYVVALPLVLFGALALWTMRGSATAFAAMLVVGSYEVQVDYGTTICVVAVTAVALVVLAARRELLGLVRGWKAPVLLLVAAVVWIPPLVDEFSSSHPNLSALVSFVLAPHVYAGLVGGASATGWASTFALGGSNFELELNRGLGITWLVLAGGGIAAVALAGRLLHRRLASQLALVALGLLVVSVVAAARIVGPPYTYLMAWSAGAAGLGVVALCLLFAPVLAKRGTIAIVVVVLVLAGAIAKFSAVPSSGVGWTAPQMPRVWAAVQRAEGVHHPRRVAIDFTGVTYQHWAFGLCDALELDSTACTVPAGYYRFILGPGHSAPAADSIYLGPPGRLPKGFRRIAFVQSSLGPFQVGWRAARPA